MTMTKALDLEEIRTHIGNFLPQTDLLTCMCLSQAWKSTLEPFLYRRIHIHHKSEESQPPLGLLLKNQHHIRALILQDRFPEEYLSLRNCPRLTKLELRGDFLIQDPWPVLEGMVRAHGSSLREMRLQIEVEPQASPASFWEAVSGCKRLRYIFLGEVEVTEDVFSAFWKSCRNLETLSMRHTLLPILPPRSTTGQHHSHQGHLLCPSKIRYLDITRLLGYMDTASQVAMVRLCPDLEVLSVFDDVWSTQVGLKTFVGEASSSARPWPNFHSVRMVVAGEMEDIHVGQLLRSMAPVQQFEIRSTNFGPISFGALMAKDLSRLWSLHLKDAIHVTSAMAQQILSTCPKLESFHAPKLDAKDVLDGAPWVCVGLKFLSIDIHVVQARKGSLSTLEQEVQQQQQQRAVLEQLGKLHELIHLDLEVYERESPRDGIFNPGAPYLHFQVDRDLDLLMHLNKMVRVWFPSIQRLEKNDVTWLIQHWPRLQSVCTGCEVTRRGEVGKLFEGTSVDLYWR